MARGKNKKQAVKRELVFIGTDVRVKVSKVVAVLTTKKMLHLDELQDGTWRLTYNPNFVDISKVSSILLHRENNTE